MQQCMHEHMGCMAWKCTLRTPNTHTIIHSHTQTHPPTKNTVADLLESQKQLRMENKSLNLQTAALEAELTRTRLERDSAVRSQADTSRRLKDALEQGKRAEPVQAQQQRLEHQDILNAAATQLRYGYHHPPGMDTSVTRYSDTKYFFMLVDYHTYWRREREILYHACCLNIHHLNIHVHHQMITTTTTTTTHNHHTGVNSPPSQPNCKNNEHVLQT